MSSGIGAATGFLRVLRDGETFFYEIYMCAPGTG